MNGHKHSFGTTTQTHKGLIAVTIIPLLLVSVTFAGQWPRFRGPNGQGISDAKTIPVKWAESDYNWKIELPGTGPSSPVVWDDKVFVTCADQNAPKGILVAVDATTGRILWKKEYSLSSSKMNKLNSYATGTPALAAAQSSCGMLRPEAGPRCGNSSSSSSSALNPSGSGQLNPAALAWVMYSLTVLGETEQLWAIARWDSPAPYFNLRTSSIFRMNNLSWDISFSLFGNRMPHMFWIIQRRPPQLIAIIRK